MNIWTDTSASTCTTPGSQKPFTIADFECAAALVRSMPPEPIGQWMRSKGCPPEQWTLLIPSKMFDFGGPVFLPSYVKRNNHIDEPMFLRRPNAP